MKKWISTPLFRLPLWRFEFTPTLIPTIVFIAFIPGLLHLADWQFARADYKTQLLSQFEHNAKKAPLSLKAFLSHTGNSQFLKLHVSGIYMNKRQFLIDNRTFKKKAGYQILSPLKISGEKKWLLINRGWVPANVDRRITPTLKPVPGTQDIIGIVKKPAKRFFMLAEKTGKKNWPRRIQNPDLKQISSALNHATFPFILQLDPKMKHGFIREWQPAKKDMADKHIGYAFQWLALLLTLVIIYAVVNTHRKKRA